MAGQRKSSRSFHLSQHRSHPRPKKRLSQHWLTDEMALMRIVQAINPKSEDHMVEIGPGPGALTAYLLPRVKRLEVIEIDPHWANELSKRFQGQAALQVHQQDAQLFDLKSIIKDDTKLRVVGNLPYRLSTPLLFRMLDQLALISDLCFLLQKEVVERITAPVGGHHYGRLSVMTQYFCHAHQLFTIGPEAFDPPPKVDSALLVMQPRTDRKLDAKCLKTFSQVVKQAFNYRRKTVHNSLGQLFSNEAFDCLGLDPGKRPQELSVDDFVRMSNYLIK